MSLDVVTTLREFYFVTRPGEVLRNPSNAAAMEKMTMQRFTLSPRLMRKIAADQKHAETATGYLCWCCFGCAGSTFDYDRDMVELRKEVLRAVAASTLLQPDADFSLVDSVEEGSWLQGRVVMKLVLRGEALPDPRKDEALHYRLANQLQGTV